MDTVNAGSVPQHGFYARPAAHLLLFGNVRWHCVAGRDDLFTNKRVCGRPKEIAGAETLDPSD